MFCSQKLLICFAIEALTFSFDVKLATSQAAYQWRLAMSWLEGTPMLSNAAVRLLVMLKNCLAGVCALLLMRQVDTKRHWVFLIWSRSGAYEMGHTTSYYYKGKDPATTFFTTTPFGITPTEMNAWYYYGGGFAYQGL